MPSFSHTYDSRDGSAASINALYVGINESDQKRFSRFLIIIIIIMLLEHGPLPVLTTSRIKIVGQVHCARPDGV